MHAEGKALPDKVELATRMRVSVAIDGAMDLQHSKRSKGDIEGIMLHSDKPAHGDKGELHRKHLSGCILVKMERTSGTQPAGPAERVVLGKLHTTTMIILIVAS